MDPERPFFGSDVGGSDQIGQQNTVVFCLKLQEGETCKISAEFLSSLSFTCMCTMGQEVKNVTEIPVDATTMVFKLWSTLSSTRRRRVVAAQNDRHLSDLV